MALPTDKGDNMSSDEDDDEESLESSYSSDDNDCSWYSVYDLLVTLLLQSTTTFLSSPAAQYEQLFSSRLLQVSAKLTDKDFLDTFIKRYCAN